MMKYIFSDMSIGLEEHFLEVVDETKMKQFAELSGDYNPLHMDNQFAKERSFDQRVVYGMLVSSFYSTLVGMYLPGENALLQDISIRFHGLVREGDSLVVNGKVVGVDKRFNRIKLKSTIRNGQGKLVSSAIIDVGFTEKKRIGEN